MNRLPARCLATLVLSLASFALHAEDLQATSAKAIVSAFGHDQGLCLVLGSGEDAAALAGASRLYVQACTGNKALVLPGRLAIEKAGAALRASLVWREAAFLPYADDLVNLLVVCDAANIPPGELQRVLAPGGTLALPSTSCLSATLEQQHGLTRGKTAGPWTCWLKPVHPDLGTWTHVKAGADQSYVGDDKVVAPWTELRWIGDPQWGSLTQSYSGLVTDGGRMYYKEAAQTQEGKQYFLVARDAYNGFEYWRASSGPPNPKYYMTDYTLCCDAERVYVSEERVLVARDGRSGKVLRRFPVRFPLESVTVTTAVLLASSKNACAAFDKRSGAQVWERASLAHPASDGTLAFVFDGKSMEAVDLRTGRSAWKTDTPPVTTGPAAEYTVSCKGGCAFLVHLQRYKPQGGVFAWHINSGSLLWQQEGKWSHGVLPFGDEVWLMNRDNTKEASMTATVRDAVSGKPKRDFRIQGNVMSKCWGVRATPHYLLYSNGWFLDRRNDSATANRATRSPCRLGQHPANGLTYFMPHHCDCHVTLRGFLAVSKGDRREWLAQGAEGAPQLFPAGGSGTGQDLPGDWPMYRRDGRRSNAAAEPGPSKPALKWAQKVGEGELTQACSAYAMLYLAEKYSQRVIALDAASGQVRWTFVADGNVETAPSLGQGLCLFGTNAGSVYCLNAQTGKENWRLRAAPVQKFIGDRGKFGSPWPVRGGVLLHEGRAYFSAGRSASQSGGLHLYAVDAASGKVLWRQKTDGSGDMFLFDGKDLNYLGRPYRLSDGKILPPRKTTGLLATTQYLTKVSIVDYINSVEPLQTDKRHIYLTDGLAGGNILSSPVGFGVAAGRYDTGFPGWKTKHGQFFLAREGGATWRLDNLPQRFVGLVVAGEHVYSAGLPASFNPQDPCELWVTNAADGRKLHALKLEHTPVYDGLSSTNGRLYLTTEEGVVCCYE